MHHSPAHWGLDRREHQITVPSRRPQNGAVQNSSIFSKEFHMDKDRIKGKAKQVAGHAQQAWGDLTDQPGYEVEGKVKHVEGEVQETVGKVKDEIRDIVNDTPGRNQP